jgi:hypothetical protein
VLIVPVSLKKLSKMFLKYKTRDILTKYSEGLTTKLPGFVSGELNFSLYFRFRLLT